MQTTNGYKHSEFTSSPEVVQKVPYYNNSVENYETCINSLRSINFEVFLVSSILPKSEQKKFNFNTSSRIVYVRFFEMNWPLDKILGKDDLRYAIITKKYIFRCCYCRRALAFYVTIFHLSKKHEQSKNNQNPKKQCYNSHEKC